MARLLIWLLLAGAVWWLWRTRQRVPPPRSSQRPAEAHAVTPMQRCAHCGLHLPATDAIAGADGHVYCCAEHRSQGPR